MTMESYRHVVEKCSLNQIICWMQGNNFVLQLWIQSMMSSTPVLNMQVLMSMPKELSATIALTRSKFKHFSTVCSMLFAAIPIKYLAKECTRKFNFFLPQGGVSKYNILREILHQQKLDFHRQCSIPQFSHVQANDGANFSNSQAACSIDNIYLCSWSKIQGGHESFTLQLMCTHLIHSDCYFHDNIHDCSIYGMAEAEGMIDCQVKVKSGHIFFESA